MKSFGKKIIALLVLAGFISISIYKVSVAIFGADQYYFSIDPLLENNTHAKLCQSLKNKHYFSLHSIASTLKCACPALEHVSILRRPNNSLSIQCQSSAPYLRLTNDLMLLSNGAVVDKSWFSVSALEPIARIEFKNEMNENLLSQEGKEWLLSLDPAITKQYFVFWHDDYHIELRDYANKNIKVICNVHNRFNEEIREKCQRIIESKKQAQGTARDFLYTADIRFEKQIILCTQKGGAHG